MKKVHSPGNSLLALLPYVKSQIGMVAISTVLRSVNLFLGMFLFGYSGYLLASGVLYRSTPDRFDWLILVLAGLFKAAARYGEQITGHVAAFRLLDSLRQKIFLGLTQRPVFTLSGLRTGDLVSRAMGDVELVEIFFAHTLAPGITSLMYIGGSALLVFLVVQPGVALILFALYFTAGILLPLLFQTILSPLGVDNRKTMGQLSAFIHESLGGIQDITAFAGVSPRVDSMNRLASRAYSRNVHLSLLNGLRDILVDGFLVASLVYLLYAGFVGYDSAHPELLWGLVAALAGGFGAILGLNRAVDDLPKSAAAASRILEILKVPEEKNLPFTHGLPAKSQADTPVVRFEKVSYEYPGGFGVRNIDFSVYPGTHVFLAGRSGAGKTTVLSLLLGFAQPKSGRVLAFQTPVTQIDPKIRYGKISAARQNSVLIRGTVQENIELGLRVSHETDETNESHETIPVHALEIPEISHLFTQLADGPATRTSGTDEQISGGQQRRIHLAAALARKPEILILDEAFAGLDAELKHRIRSNLITWARQNKVTLVEVSHELTDARDVDRVLVLDRGALVEQGTYEELVQQEGFFWDLLEN